MYRKCKTQTVLLGRDEQGHCPGSIKGSFFEKVTMHREEFREAERRERFHQEVDFRERDWWQTKSQKQKGPSVLQLLLHFSKLLIDYILSICMCEQLIRAGVLGKFRQWPLWMDVVFMYNWYMTDILNSVDFHGYCLGEMATQPL